MIVFVSAGSLNQGDVDILMKKRSLPKGEMVKHGEWT
jgi:hypothetical protein